MAKNENPEMPKIHRRLLKFGLMNLGNALRVKSSPHKMLRNEINSLNALRNELIKVFRGFRFFECALWQKAKTRNFQKSPEKFVNQKTPIVNRYHYQRPATKQFQ